MLFDSFSEAGMRRMYYELKIRCAGDFRKKDGHGHHANGKEGVTGDFGSASCKGAP